MYRRICNQLLTSNIIDKEKTNQHIIIAIYMICSKCNFTKNN